jgi:hypothetical protein
LWNRTYASKVLRTFAEERRRIISDWRIHIHARRIAYAENAPLPDLSKAEAIRRELQQRGDIIPVEGVGGVFVVDVPYATLLEESEEQVIQEANPWAVFGFLTALIYHGLTDLPGKEIYAIQFKDGNHSHRLPLGTTPEDWADLKYPSPRQPRKIREVPVHWTEVPGKWEFGLVIGYSSGLPIYVTDLERTLLDSIRMPEKCGGIGKVLYAWRSAEHLDVERMVSHVDEFGIQVLRQRVGYLLEKLEHTHPRLQEWRRGLQRGGSLKLVASEPYSETFSPEWNLSLNVPPSVLAILE